ncbi:MAG: ABC transporter ATP-binding protein [Gemmatimonadales bacterium]|nr:MAG: ABC transporter ATP-binding protein [Gemmatimonadales bacterium]
MIEHGVSEADVAVPPLEAREVRRTFTMGDGSELEVLRGVDFTLQRGEAVAIVGTSGSGKSTLLHLFGALDRPTSGEIRLGGENLAGRKSQELARIRNRYVGFVFQFHHLLREFTSLENVMLPGLIEGRPRQVMEARARELLGEVGLSARLQHRPWQLSGGEQQRVAVARALVNDPAVVLADEPSGNLDDRTSEALHDLLFRLRGEWNLSLVLVTHNRELAARADRALLLSEGRLDSTHASGETP